MLWVSRLLHKVRVWVRARETGAPVVGSDGRVDVIYKPGGKVYRAWLRNLQPDPDPQDFAETPVRKAQSPAPAPAPAPAAVNPVVIYADGACSGNPGPCGLGVVILDGGERRELSEYLGMGTNNVAELTAIIRALEEAPRDRTVMLHSDSSYALGLLSQNWKAK